MDTRRQKALREKGLLIEQRAAIDRKIADIDTFLTLDARYGATVEPVVPQVFYGGSESCSVSDMSVADAAHTIIHDHGPAHTADLLQALEQRGKPVGGAKPAVNLASTLSRDDRFKSDRIRGWMLTPIEQKENPEP